MSEIEVIRVCYQRLVEADFPHAGTIAEHELRIKAVPIQGCHGNSRNILLLSCSTAHGAIDHIKYECQYCDVTMYVTAELVCDVVAGRPVRALAAIDENDLSGVLGGESRKIFRQAKTALRLLAEGLGEAAGQNGRDT